MNSRLITLILAAGCLSTTGAVAAVVGPTGNFDKNAVWARPDMNTVDAVGMTTRGIAYFDMSNSVGTVDRLTEAIAAARATGSLSTAELAEVEQVLAVARVMSDDADALAIVSDWLKEHCASPHRADMELLFNDLLLEKGSRSHDCLAAASAGYDKISLDALSPDLRADLLYHRAYAYLMLAEYAKSEAAFADPELLASGEYGNAARFYLGYIKYMAGNYAAAVEDWNKVNVSTMPGRMADYYRAQISYLNGNYAEALRLARPLLGDAAVPGAFTAEANRIVGESLYQQGNPSEAISYLKKYMSEVDTPERSACYILGLAQYEEGDYSAAVETLTPVTTEQSAMGQSAYLYIGQALLKLGDDNGAIMAFNRALSMDFDHAVTEAAYYNYAVAKSRGAGVPFASSVTVFEDFLSRFPDSRYADNVAQHIVSGYLTDGNYEAALASINKVKHPSNAILAAKQKVLYTLGAKLLAADRAAEAVDMLNQASALARFDAETAAETNLVLGEALYRTGDYDTAASALIAYLDAVPSSTPNSAVARYDLGYTRMAQKDWAKAQTDFERVIANPGNLNKVTLADAQSRLGDARYYQRDWSGASLAYDAAYELDPSSGDYPLFQKAVMQGYNRDYTGKLSTLDRLVNTFPSSAIIPDALMERAEVYILLQQPAKADDEYRTLIASYPGTVQGRRAYLFLASDLAGNGDIDGAIDTYQKLIAAAGTSDEALLADQAVKRLHAERGTLGEYSEFVAGVEGAPTLDASEAETLAWNAAEHAWLGGKGTALLEKYIADYPTGRYTAKAINIMLEKSETEDNDDATYSWASMLVKNFPDNAGVESALIDKADIEYERGRGLDALATWEMLEQKASTPENKNIARLGIMRVARDTGDAKRMGAMADALLASSALGGDDKTEAAFSRALAYNLEGSVDEAVEAWKKLAVNADDLYGAKSAVYAAEALNAGAKYAEAAKVSEAFVNSGTPHTYWLARGFITLADAYAGQGRDFEAREYVKALKENYPGNEADIMDMIEQRLNK